MKLSGAHWVCVARCEDCERMTTDRRWPSVDNRAGVSRGEDGIVVGEREARMQASCSVGTADPCGGSSEQKGMGSLASVHSFTSLALPLV